MVKATGQGVLLDTIVERYVHKIIVQTLVNSRVCTAY